MTSIKTKKDGQKHSWILPPPLVLPKLQLLWLALVKGATTILNNPTFYCFHIDNYLVK